MARCTLKRAPQTPMRRGSRVPRRLFSFLTARGGRVERSVAAGFEQWGQQGGRRRPDFRSARLSGSRAAGTYLLGLAASANACGRNAEAFRHVDRAARLERSGHSRAPARRLLDRAPSRTDASRAEGVSRPLVRDRGQTSFHLAACILASRRRDPVCADSRSRSSAAHGRAARTRECPVRREQQPGLARPRRRLALRGSSVLPMLPECYGLSVAAAASGVDAGRDLRTRQLDLLSLVSQRPEVDAPTSGACVARQQLRTVLGGAHTDPLLVDVGRA